MASELQPGAVCIDYVGAMSGSAAFEELCVVDAATSWAPQQHFHVYRRR